MPADENTIQFRSPKFEQAAIEIPLEASRMNRTFNGTLCSQKGDEYAIKNNIIHFLTEEQRQPMSLAQSTNHWTITAYLYENLWRKRSLSLLSGEEFPIEKEAELLIRWLNPKPKGLYLDVGCSTALYAREVKKAASEANVVAIDFSMQMLEEARIKAEADETNLFLLHADARFMPFFGSTFDGLMCGGTLNELSDPMKVLYECRRVLKDDGTFFVMHLIQSGTWYGRLLQESAGLSGLHFWSLQESNALFERAGFTVADQLTRGIVSFTKLKPA